MPFQSGLDIINQALIYSERPIVSGPSEFSEEAFRMNLAYHRIREFELQRNLWTFATRRAYLYPMTTSTVSVTWPAYAGGTTYSRGLVVSYQGQNWASMVDGNIGNTPGTAPTYGRYPWEVYTGPNVADLWSGSANADDGVIDINNLPGSYHIGDVVYTVLTAGTGVLFISNTDNSEPFTGSNDTSSNGGGNQANPALPDSWNNAIMYQTGQVVAYPSASTTYYQSTINLNFNYEPDLNPLLWINITPTIATYNAGTTYTQGQTVVASGLYYYSLVNSNTGNTPASSPADWQSFTPSSTTASASWSVVSGATLAQFRLIYPAGAGPVSDALTRNAYQLPNAFLKHAPDDPKMGLIPYLGGPTGKIQRDWQFEAGYIISSDIQPLLMRFVASLQDVTQFHPMFCSGLAAALALDTNLPSMNKRDLTKEYRRIIMDARAHNAIEAGKTVPPD